MALGEENFRNVSEPVMLYKATRKAGSTPGVAIDPVCRMSLRAEQPTPVVVHDGKEFRFCSEGCAERFAEDPKAFTQ